MKHIISSTNRLILSLALVATAALAGCFDDTAPATDPNSYQQTDDALNLAQHCRATPISCHHLLTAAHCLGKKLDDGTIDYYEFLESMPQLAGLGETLSFHIHPLWNGKLAHDIGIIETDVNMCGSSQFAAGFGQNAEPSRMACRPPEVGEWLNLNRRAQYAGEPHIQIAPITSVGTDRFDYNGGPGVVACSGESGTSVRDRAGNILGVVTHVRPPFTEVDGRTCSTLGTATMDREWLEIVMGQPVVCGPDPNCEDWTVSYQCNSPECCIERYEACNDCGNDLPVCDNDLYQCMQDAGVGGCGPAWNDLDTASEIGSASACMSYSADQLLDQFETNDALVDSAALTGIWSNGLIVDFNCRLQGGNSLLSWESLGVDTAAPTSEQLSEALTLADTLLSRSYQNWVTGCQEGLARQSAADCSFFAECASDCESCAPACQQELISLGWTEARATAACPTPAQGPDCSVMAPCDYECASYSFDGLGTNVSGGPVCNWDASSGAASTTAQCESCCAEMITACNAANGNYFSTYSQCCAQDVSSCYATCPEPEDESGTIMCPAARSAYPEVVNGTEYQTCSGCCNALYTSSSVPNVSDCSSQCELAN